MAPRAEAQAGDPAALLGDGIAEITDRVACPLLTVVAGPTGALGQTLKDVVCALRSLGYKIRTVYRRPDGTELVRETGALLILPTLVNADDDILPDLQVSLTPSSTERFEMRIDRALLETGPLPVRVEAIARDPTGGSIPRENVAFGYDARESRAPQSMRTAITVGESATEPDATTVGLGTSVSGPGPSLAIVGGIFDGTAADRTNPIGARLNYTGVPGSSGAELVLGRRLGVRLTTSQPTRLEGTAEKVDSADASVHARVLFDKLAPAIEGIYDPDHDTAKPGNQIAVDYSASARVETFDADFKTRAAGAEDQVVVRTKGLPTGVRTKLTGPSAGSVETSGGPIESAEVGFANGAPKLRTTDNQYVNIIEEGPLKSTAARAHRLVRATFDAATKIQFDGQFAPPNPKPLDIEVHDANRDISGQVEKVPSHVKLDADFSGGRVEFDGFGEPTGRMTVDARQNTPFFSTTKRIIGDLSSIPAKSLLMFSGGDPAKVDFIGSSAIETAELGFANTTPVMRDTDSQYVHQVVKDGVDSIAAQVARLREAHLSVAKSGALSFEGQFTPPNPKPMEIKLDKPAQKVDAKVESLPAHLKFDSDFGAGKVDFNGFGQPTGRMTFDATQTLPFFERATRLVGDLTSIPPITNLRFSSGGAGNASVAVNDKIAKAEFTASNGSAEKPAGAGSGAVYRDVLAADGQAPKYVIAARVSDFRGMSFTGGPAKRIKVEHKAGPFGLVYEGSRSAQEPKLIDTADAAIRDIPGKIDLLLDLAAGKFALDGDSDIGEIDVEARSSGVFADRIKRLLGRIREIPGKVEITAKPEAGGFRFASKALPVPGSPDPQADKPLGLVDLIANDATGADDRTPDNRSGALVRDLPDLEATPATNEGRFHAAVRLKKLSGAFVRTKPTLVAELATGEAQPFEIDYRFDEDKDAINAPAEVKATVDRLPTRLRIERGGQIDWSANATIPSVHAEAHNLPGAKLDGDVHELVADIKDVPKVFTAYDGKAGTLTRMGVQQFLPDATAFSSIDIEAWDHGPRRPAPPADRNTVLLDKTGGRMHALVKIFDVIDGFASTIGDSLGVDSRFSAENPKPLFADIHSPPTTFIGRVPRPPKTLELDVSSGVDSRVKYVANRHIPDLDATLFTKAAGAELFIDNLPPKAEFCIDSSGFACDVDMPQTVIANHDDDETYTVLNDFNTFLEVDEQEGDLVFNGWACFDPEDGPTYSKFFVPSECFDEGADFFQTGNRDPDMRKFLRIDNLRLNGDFDFEFGEGDTLQGEDGTPGSCGFDPDEDGIIKLWFDTTGQGLLANSILYQEKAFDECDDMDEEEQDIQVLKGGLPRLTANNYWIWIDADPPPDAVAETTEPGAFLQCDNTSILIKTFFSPAFDAEPLLPICD